MRQAWVRAVAARAALHYAHKVADAALASDELAARMLAAGNFNALTRSKHRLFHVQAQMQLAAAQQSKLSRTEELVRLLGLDATQALQLQLPDKLPELPVTAISTESATQQAVQQRLDIRMAKAELETAARAQGLTGITSLLEVELTVIGGTVNSGGTDTKRSGAQISVKLPLFDGGDMQQSQMHAQTLAAANRLRAAATDAASSLRETHAAYSTAFAIARQFQDEVLPLRQRMADENLVRYNAMQIGVFDSDFNLWTWNSRVFPGIDSLNVRLNDRVRIRIGNLTMTNHPIHLHGHEFQVTGTDGGAIPMSARWSEVTTDIAVGQMRQIEFVADEEGDWAFHCHKSHHTMNAMGHKVPTMIGVEQADLAKKINRLIPDYMVMGKDGMGDMAEMEMPMPDNTLPMMTGQGPFGGVGMGGMFSVLKVRRDQAPGDYSDPGWYKHPPGTVATEVTGEVAAPVHSTEVLSEQAAAIELQVRKPAGGQSGH